MLNKWKIVEEEADETLFWLELLVESNLMPETELKPLMTEVNEILSMVVASTHYGGATVLNSYLVSRISYLGL
jgi:four helix bundle protein